MNLWQTVLYCYYEVKRYETRLENIVADLHIGNGDFRLESRIWFPSIFDELP